LLTVPRDDGTSTLHPYGMDHRIETIVLNLNSDWQGDFSVQY